MLGILLPHDCKQALQIHKNNNNQLQELSIEVLKWIKLMNVTPFATLWGEKKCEIMM
jgi:hypothetical protein